VKAPIEEVWAYLLDSKKSAEFFWGISFVSDLKKGSPITWSGVWEGKPFVDRGFILEIEKPRLFRYSYFSAFSGVPDVEENRQILTYAFDPVQEGVRLRITQTNVKTPEAKEHSEKNWGTMLKAIKEKAEAR
jgi:uncharacterized protein YndB with AHSA1/START domain